MSYSHTRHPNDPDLIPEPPLWLAWYSDGYWVHDADGKAGVRLKGDERRDRGQVRHYPTLLRARKQIAPYGRRRRPKDEVVFYSDWAIYKWEGDRYVLKYEGTAGEKVDGHPLWERGVASSEEPPTIPERVLERTLASLREVAS